jgi:hypothetical protein
MATLDNPISAQNLIDRFAAYVVATANSGIVWGTDSVPFPEMATFYFGGPRSGLPISISGAGLSGTVINALNIYNAISAETYRYSRIRNMRAILNLLSSGSDAFGRPPSWNMSLGPRYGSPGFIFDQTRKSHLNEGITYFYGFGGGVPGSFPLNTIGILARGQPVTGATITRAGLDDLFDRARSLYLNWLATSSVTVSINVCHASCHSSCHNSRVRR